MKRIFQSLVVITLLLACSTDHEILSKKNSEPVVIDQNYSAAARAYADNYTLTYNNDGRWYGWFAGCTVWFWGPSPEELANGMQSAWSLATACADPNSSSMCYSDFTVWGDGSGFTVQTDACAMLGSSTIEMRKYDESTHSWTTQNTTVQTFSGTNCSINASAKLILNENCMPVIVTEDSGTISGCVVFTPGDLTIIPKRRTDYSSYNMGIVGNAYSGGNLNGDGTALGLHTPTKTGDVYTWTWSGVNLISGGEFFFLKDGIWGGPEIIFGNYTYVGGTAVLNGKIVDAVLMSKPEHNFYVTASGVYNITLSINNATEVRSVLIND